MKIKKMKGQFLFGLVLLMAVVFGGCPPTLKDTAAPTAPDNLSVTVISSSQINLRWEASTDSVGVSGYKIFRDNTEIKDSSTLTYADTGLSANTKYCYMVKAYDAAGNLSPDDNEKCETTAASSTPSTTTGVGQFDGNYTGSWISLCPTCGDGDAAGTFTATLENGVFTHTSFPITSGTHGILFDSGTVSSSGAITGTGQTPSQCNSVSTFTGQITTNSSGNAGMILNYSRPASPGGCAAESGTITATRTTTTFDTTAPATPANLTATAVSSSQIDLSWAASTDAVGVIGYKIYRGGAEVGISTTTTFSDKNLTANTQYCYDVKAYDAAGNLSPDDNEKCETTAASSTPSTTTGVGQFDGNYTGSWISLCPTCGDGDAVGIFTATLENGVFTHTSFPITSGTHGILFDSGTVSSSGAITGTGKTPSQCNSVSTFTGQITTNSSGNADMILNYSRPASPGGCAAESGTITATRTTTST